MGFLKIFLLLFSICSVTFFWFKFVEKEVHIPETVYRDHYWGRKILKAGDPLPKDDVTIKPFKVVYDEEFVKDLQSRLNRTRFVEPLIGLNFENGFNGDYLQKVVHYWRNNYDWRKQVDYLNKFPQFMTQIEGLDIHFVRIKPLDSPKIIKPFVIVNGWPSNYYQLYKLAELMTKKMGDVGFEIIIPSRPGYGYSEAPHYPGFSISDSVRIYVKLMKRLNHNKFYFAGEDWGSIESQTIAALYPQNIEGFHSSMGFAGLSIKQVIKMTIGKYWPSLVYNDEMEAKQSLDLMSLLSNTVKEMGYFMIQSTKPDTVGASLIDSPTGLAGYVLEKYSTWVNKNYINLQDGGLTQKLNLDELLTNIMIFWQTGNGAYSTRYYKEYSKIVFTDQDPSQFPVDRNLPAGFSIGEYDLDLAKIRPSGKFNIVKFDYLKNTGHFSSFENPQLVSEHLRKFVKIVMELNKKPKDKEL